MLLQVRPSATALGRAIRLAKFVEHVPALHLRLLGCTQPLNDVALEAPVPRAWTRLSWEE